MFIQIGWSHFLVSESDSTWSKDLILSRCEFQTLWNIRCQCWLLRAFLVALTSAHTRLVSTRRSTNVYSNFFMFKTAWVRYIFVVFFAREKCPILVVNSFYLSAVIWPFACCTKWLDWCRNYRLNRVTVNCAKNFWLLKERILSLMKFRLRFPLLPVRNFNGKSIQSSRR